MQRGNRRWVPTRECWTSSRDLTGYQQQAPPAPSVTMGIVTSSAISRRVSVEEMLCIPSLACAPCKKNREWPRSHGTPARVVRSLACAAACAYCVVTVGGVHVAAVTGRGCGHAWGRSLSYQAEISRASPTAIVIVMDQSASMNHRLKSGQSKAAFLADVLNKTLYTLITSCSKAEGVRDYFYVGVVAYGGEDARNGFQGALDGEALHAVSRLAARARRRCAPVSMRRSGSWNDGAMRTRPPFHPASCT